MWVVCLVNCFVSKRLHFPNNLTIFFWTIQKHESQKRPLHVKECDDCQSIGHVLSAVECWCCWCCCCSSGHLTTFTPTPRHHSSTDQDSGTLRRRLLTFKPAAGRAKIRTFNRNITSEKYLLLHHFTTAIKPLSGVGELVQNRHKYEIISGYFLTILCSIRKYKNFNHQN